MVACRILLLAERWNFRRIERWDHLCAEGRHDRWAEVSLRAGAYGTGLSRNERGRRKLRSLGMRYTSAMNLLPPSPVAGEWDHSQAVDSACAVMRNIMLAIDSGLMIGATDTPEVPQDFRCARWLHHVTLLLGRRVERAMLGYKLPYFEPHPWGHYGIFITVPHPSGQNRWWNDEDRVDDGRRRLTEFLQEADRMFGGIEDHECTKH